MRVSPLFVFLFFFTLLVISALWSASIRAQELEAYIIDAESVVEFEYEPFSGQPSSRSWTLEISALNQDDNDGSDDDPDNQVGQNGPSPQRLLLRYRTSELQDFRLISDSGALPLEFLRANQSDTILTRLTNEYQQEVLFDPTNESQVELDLLFRIPASVYAEAGQFTLRLDVEIFDADSLESVSDVFQLSLDANVEKRLQTNIAGTRGSYEDGVTFSVIDFEKLTTNESRRVFIQVRGNAPANIKVSSENDGRMKHEEREDTYVDYSVVVDGESSTLESPLELQRIVASDLEGSAYPMTVTIGNVDSSYAGAYQDLITIDVSPQ